MKEIDDNRNRWNDILYSKIGIINIAKVNKQPKKCTDSVQSLLKQKWQILKELEEIILKLVQTHKGSQIARAILRKKGEKKKKAGSILLYFMISDYTAKLQPSKLYGNGSFPGSPVIGLHTSTAEVYVQSLDGELRSHMPQCKKTQKFH